MQVINGHFAPPVILELVRHYDRHYNLRMRKLLCVDDYRYPAGVYNRAAKTLVLNFATMPNERYKFGLQILDFVPSLWAVQICCTLFYIRRAIQSYTIMANWDIKKLQEEAMDWTAMEVLRLIGLDEDFYMPDKLIDKNKKVAPMGIIGLRARKALADSYIKGGARKDAACLKVKGAIEFARMQKFMKHDAVQELRPLIEKSEIGRTERFWTFLTFREFFVYVLDDCALQKHVVKTRKEKEVSLLKESAERMRAARISMSAATTDNLPAGG